MTDTRSDRSFVDDGRVSVASLASQALDRVMAPGRASGDCDDENLPYPDIIEALCAAYLADDPDMRRNAVSDLLRSGVSTSDFVQSHASDTSRMLGDLWAENKISFVETTIGVARIQETVRSLTARRQVETSNVAETEILLVAPEAEDHLLGLFVACEQFEDLGCYVHLAIGKSADEISDLAKQRRFAMIGISISSLRTVKDARAVVQKLRASRARNVPIVLGGGLVCNITNYADILADVDADHIISSPEAALKHCGIAIPSRQRKANG